MALSSDCPLTALPKEPETADFVTLLPRFCHYDRPYDTRFGVACGQTYDIPNLSGTTTLRQLRLSLGLTLWQDSDKYSVAGRRHVREDLAIVNSESGPGHAERAARE